MSTLQTHIERCERAHKGEPVKKIIENLSDVKPGDWIEAEYTDSDGKAHPFEGEAWESAPGSLAVGSNILRWSDDEPARNVRVKRITRTVPDLPTEPGVVFYATVRGVENMQVVVTDNYNGSQYFTHAPCAAYCWHAAPDIDPDTVRIVYTPGQEAGQ